MKVLVYFNPNKKYDNFEGARVRKTIKGALELIEVEHTNSFVDFYDVAHLISKDDENKINEIKENGAPVIVSALYAENDPSASFIDDVIRNDKHEEKISPKALKFLNKADRILVPCESAKEILIKAGVTSEVSICYPGVNLARFDFSKEDEKEIFYRYYQEDRNKKLVLAVGEYVPKMSGINSFMTAAKKCPQALFYFMGQMPLRVKLSIRFKKLINNAPNNVKFVEVPANDIYRSALLNASVFMVPGYKYTGVTSIVEAMAAKTQIIARKSALFPGFLEDAQTAYIAEFSETLSSLTKDFLDGKIKPTTQKAYEEISTHSLPQLGEILRREYQDTIQHNVRRRLEDDRSRQN